MVSRYRKYPLIYIIMETWCGGKLCHDCWAVIEAPQDVDALGGGCRLKHTLIQRQGSSKPITVRISRQRRILLRMTQPNQFRELEHQLEDSHQEIQGLRTEKGRLEQRLQWARRDVREAERKQHRVEDDLRAERRKNDEELMPRLTADCKRWEAMAKEEFERNARLQTRVTLLENEVTANREVIAELQGPDDVVSIREKLRKKFESEFEERTKALSARLESVARKETMEAQADVQAAKKQIAKL